MKAKEIKSQLDSVVRIVREDVAHELGSIACGMTKEQKRILARVLSSDERVERDVEDSRADVSHVGFSGDELLG